MPLRKEDIERIGNGAIKYLHSIPLSTDGRYEIQIKAYISGATAEAEKANELVEALEFTKGQVQDMDKWNQEAKKEIEKLKGLIELYEEKNNNPYWYWPQCDVDGCEGVSGNNGTYWRETGYWCLCPKHSQMGREGKPQPKMRQSAIDKEATRDKETGCLP